MERRTKVRLYLDTGKRTITLIFHVISYHFTLFYIFILLVHNFATHTNHLDISISSVDILLLNCDVLHELAYVVLSILAFSEFFLMASLFIHLTFVNNYINCNNFFIFILFFSQIFEFSFTSKAHPKHIQSTFKV